MPPESQTEVENAIRETIKRQQYMKRRKTYLPSKYDIYLDFTMGIREGLKITLTLSGLIL